MIGCGNCVYSMTSLWLIPMVFGLRTLVRAFMPIQSMTMVLNLIRFALLDDDDEHDVFVCDCLEGVLLLCDAEGDVNESVDASSLKVDGI